MDAEPLALLRALESERMPHREGRSLFEHLVGTAAIAEGWTLPAHVRHAALFHSVYGTSVYREAAATFDRRDTIRAAIGARAERLAFAFGILDRGEFRDRLAAMPVPHACSLSRHAGAPIGLDATEVLELTMLGVMNELEQTSARDGTPASWRTRCPSLVDALVRWDAPDLPAIVREALRTTLEDERAAIVDYERAVRSLRSDPAAAVSILEPLGATSLGVAEPLVWLAFAARRRNARDEVARLVEAARARFDAWNTAWDKRLSVDAWRRELDSAAGAHGTPGLDRLLFP